MFEGVVSYLSDPGIWVSFITLSLLEIVLGIDNVIFISIVANRLSEPARTRARGLGLLLALFMRVAFLASVLALVGMNRPIYSYEGFQLTWRDLILGAGGLFLLYKATFEIGSEMRGEDLQEDSATAATFGLIVGQIVFLDLVFSIDSIITAVGLSRELPVMVAAIVVAILVMLLASGPVGHFIHRHPNIKMMAFVFLLLVGFALVGDALGVHLDRAYLYLAIGFSFIVELATLTLARRFEEAVPFVFATCAAILLAATFYLRSAGFEMPWAYVYVPVGFGYVVQFLHVVTQRLRGSKQAS